MSNSSIPAQIHSMACSNRNSCHPLLLYLGLMYVLFLVLCLVGSTCFDRRDQVGIRDVESNLGRREDRNSGEFEKRRAYGTRPVV